MICIQLDARVQCVCMCVCVVNVIGVSLCVEKPIEDFVSLVTRKAIPIMERECVCAMTSPLYERERIRQIESPIDD